MDDQESRLDQKRRVPLSLETVRQLLIAEEPHVEILDLDEAPGSGRGDNYTSMLYRLSVRGRRQSEPWSRSLICKILPESRERRDCFRSELLFRNEVVFYTKVWPELLQLQASPERRVFDGVAKIYIARADLIVMEDLSARGFVMGDRTKGLSLDKMRHVLKALAGFHALSLALKELRPEVFSRLSAPQTGCSEVEPTAVQETLFRLENEDWYRQYYRSATSNAIKMVEEGLPAELGCQRRSEIVTKFREFLKEERFFRMMCELTSHQGPLSVFCHGDSWTNNILFREQNKQHDKVAVCLVDFQLMRVGSLALDLSYLLYLCTTGEVRKVYMNQLLQHYHQSLLTALHTLNPDSELTKDPATVWNLLSEEMQRCGRYALGSAVDMLPITTCKSDQAPDVYESQEASDKEASGPTAVAPPPAGAECTRRMADLVLEFELNRVL